MSMKIMPREQACDDGECPEFGTPWRGFLPCPKLIEPQALTFHCVPPYENDLPLWFSSYSNSTLPGFVRDSKRAQKESGNSDKNIRLSVSIVYETTRLHSLWGFERNRDVSTTTNGRGDSQTGVWNDSARLLCSKMDFSNADLPQNLKTTPVEIRALLC